MPAGEEAGRAGQRRVDPGQRGVEIAAPQRDARALEIDDPVDVAELAAALDLIEEPLGLGHAPLQEGVERSVD